MTDLALTDPRTHRLQVLADTASTCTMCRLADGRTNSVFARGNPAARVAILGEGPGEQEDRDGRPFVGQSGSIIDKLAAEAGLVAAGLYFLNVVKCRPPENRTPKKDEVTACRSFFEEQIALVQPRVIIALGATAAQALLQTKEKITDLRGRWFEYRGARVMVTYHPAFLFHRPSERDTVRRDLEAVMQYLAAEPAAP
jgi:uracil-DNA glycosylase family 4